MNSPRGNGDDEVVAIVGGVLIDGRGGEPVRESVIIVRGSRIVAAGPASEIATPAVAKVVNVSGKTVLPGLVDAHIHGMRQPEIARMFLRNGVTTARDSGLPFEFFEMTLGSGWDIPRLYLTGNHLDQAPPAWPLNAIIVNTAEETAAAVNGFVDRGGSAVKIYYRLPVDLIKVACDTARERGVPVTAHLELVSARAAIEAGLGGLEHVSSVGLDVAEPEVAEAFRASVDADNDQRRPGRVKLWATVDLQSERVREMVEFLRERGVVMSPTLTYFYGSGPMKNDTEEHRRAYTNMLGFVRMCYEAGVPVVVGSHLMLDVEPGGQALQKEMEILVEAGMSPADVIVAATQGGARFLGAEKRIGTIEPGKLADLIVVDGDPVADIRTMRNVNRVMLNGVWVWDTGNPPK